MRPRVIMVLVDGQPDTESKLKEEMMISENGHRELRKRFGRAAVWLVAAVWAFGSGVGCVATAPRPEVLLETVSDSYVKLGDKEFLWLVRNADTTTLFTTGQKVVASSQHLLLCKDSAQGPHCEIVQVPCPREGAKCPSLHSPHKTAAKKKPRTAGPWGRASASATGGDGQVATTAVEASQADEEDEDELWSDRCELMAQAQKNLRYHDKEELRRSCTNRCLDSTPPPGLKPCLKTAHKTGDYGKCAQFMPEE